MKITFPPYVNKEAFLSNVEQYTLLRKDDILGAIEMQLSKLVEPDNYQCGAGLLPDILADGVLIRKVYKSGNKQLIELFKKYIAVPSSSVFGDGDVPQEIVDKESKSADYVLDLLKDNQYDISRVEQAVKTIQRKIRASKRAKEMKTLKDEIFSSKESQRKFEEGLRAEGHPDKPYIPKCKPDLAARLLEAASNIKPFNTVRHLTAYDAIPSILDESLFGRKSLLREYKLFRPAALQDTDQLNGDADAICMGAFDVDLACMKRNTVELVFDLNLLKKQSIEESNPCLFFKQQDLEYDPKTIREININGTEIIFSHTSNRLISLGKPRHKLFKIFHADKNPEYFDSIKYFSEIFSFQLISTNFKSMYMILAMNFFRYLDKNDMNPELINEIYSSFDKQSDKQLVETLTELTRKISDTMELNFYGAFQVPLDVIQQINVFTDDINSPSIKINVQDLLNEINQGKTTILTDIMEIAPKLLQSYRFIDFLMSHSKHTEIIDFLEGCRSKIELPLWRKKYEEILKKQLDSDHDDVSTSIANLKDEVLVLAEEAESLQD